MYQKHHLELTHLTQLALSGYKISRLFLFGRPFRYVTDRAKLSLTVSLRPQSGAIATSKVAIAAAFICGVTVGCNSSDVAEKKIEAQYDDKSGRLSRLDYDANGNGKPDTWAFMDGMQIIKLEADENEDGKVDRWECTAFQCKGRGKPAPERIDRATRLDGRVSRREFFEQGRLARIEEDTDADGSTDKWSTYAGGTLATLSMDTQRRGKPDRRLIYRPDGTLDRIETDSAGTGNFQPVKQ